MSVRKTKLFVDLIIIYRVIMKSRFVKSMRKEIKGNRYNLLSTLDTFRMDDDFMIS